MGRSASHIALECALQTQPNLCLISEEVENKSLSINQIVEEICASVIKRAENKENFGVVLIPEGLIEFIPEMKQLIGELNDAMSAKEPPKNAQGISIGEDISIEEDFSKISSFIDQLSWLRMRISPASMEILHSLPPDIARQLLMDRDPHGNVQVSRVETEKLLIEMVEKRLAKLKQDGIYKGKFSPLGHFFGYEGRCAFPSNFDADYCYSLCYTAFLLIASGLTCYVSNVKNLSAPANEWIAGGVPLTMMMNMEQRHGSKKPVIKKALVELEGEPFKAFDEVRDSWAVKTSYLYPGAIQYYGPTEVCDQPTKTLKLEHKKF